MSLSGMRLDELDSPADIGQRGGREVDGRDVQLFDMVLPIQVEGAGKLLTRIDNGPNSLCRQLGHIATKGPGTQN